MEVDSLVVEEEAEAEAVGKTFMEKKQPIKIYVPFIIDILILVGFYFSLRSSNDFNFLNDGILPYAPVFILSILFLFFFAFYFLLITSDKLRKKVGVFWKKRKEISNKWKRRLINWLLWVFLMLYGFVHFILYFVVIVMGSSLDDSLVPTWVAYPTVLILVVSTLVFSILYVYLSGGPDDPEGEVERHRAVMKKSLPKRPVWNSVLFALSSIVLPIYTLWTYLNFISDIEYTSAVKIEPRTHRQIFGWIEILFGILILAILHFEVTVPDANYAGMTLSRAVVFFAFLYLPFKLMSVMVNENRNRFLFELAWAGLFFIAQLVILYQFI